MRELLSGSAFLWAVPEIFKGEGMKEELQGRLVEILTSIQNSTGKAADFAMAELPDIAQQYLSFGRLFETFMLVILTVIIGLLVWGTVWIVKNANQIDKPAAIVPVIFLFIFFIFWCAQLKDVLMVWLAPKVWLITELAKLIK
jgi:hypothetical protein